MTVTGPLMSAWGTLSSGRGELIVRSERLAPPPMWPTRTPLTSAPAGSETTESRRVPLRSRTPWAVPSLSPGPKEEPTASTRTFSTSPSLTSMPVHSELPEVTAEGIRTVRSLSFDM